MMNSYYIQCFCLFVINMICCVDLNDDNHYCGPGRVKTEEDIDICDVHVPCTLDDPVLRERRKTDLHVHNMSFLEHKFNDTQAGGRWQPRHCRALKRIAIIIPFRDRGKHLKQLLNNLIPKLRRQKADYTFYVVEQAPGSRFNRGLVKNIGFAEARKHGEYDCYIFNDVDNVIESDYNFYTCKEGVIFQIATRLQRHEYRLVYPSYVGGIVSFTGELFQRANGYSNFIFIWGGEDDDLWRRVRDIGGIIERTPQHRGFVSTLYHPQDVNHIERYDLYQAIRQFSNRDGLNSLHYTSTVIRKKLFTHVYAEVNETHYYELFNEYKQEHEASLRAGIKKHQRYCYRKTVFQYLKPQSVCLTNMHKTGKIEHQAGSKPGDSKSYRRVTIIIPFQCQHKQLKYVTDIATTILHGQNIVPTFYVIEQEHGSRFNRGLLNNIGFLEAFKQEEQEKPECYIFMNTRRFFHDNCTSQLHKQSLIDELRRPFVCDGRRRWLFNTYRCIVSAFSRLMVMLLNGYSNFYFNSEMEHKDMYRRIKSTDADEFNFKDIFQACNKRFNNESLAVYNRILPYSHKDGLNTVRYKLVRKRLSQRKSFTWINVRIDESYYVKMLQRYTNGD